MSCLSILAVTFYRISSTHAKTSLQLFRIKQLSRNVSGNIPLNFYRQGIFRCYAPFLGWFWTLPTTQEMDKLWEENNWDDNTITEWANEHLKTPYNPI